MQQNKRISHFKLGFGKLLIFSVVKYFMERTLKVYQENIDKSIMSAIVAVQLLQRKHLFLKCKNLEKDS